MSPARQLGDAESAQYTQYAGAAAGTAVSGAAAAGLISASAAGPIGLAIAGVTLLVTHLIANSGCGPTCILASDAANRLEEKLRANRDTYLATHGRTASDQAAALAAFDFGFAWLRSSQACGAPELGDAGRRCISERDRGGKWDWYALYRDPIAADQPPGAAPLSLPSGGAWLLPALLLVIVGLSL